MAPDPITVLKFAFDAAASSVRLVVNRSPIIFPVSADGVEDECGWDLSPVVIGLVIQHIPRDSGQEFGRQFLETLRIGSMGDPESFQRACQSGLIGGALCKMEPAFEMQHLYSPWGQEGSEERVRRSI